MNGGFNAKIAKTVLGFVIRIDVFIFSAPPFLKFEFLILTPHPNAHGSTDPRSPKYNFSLREPCICSNVLLALIVCCMLSMSSPLFQGFHKRRSSAEWRQYQLLHHLNRRRQRQPPDVWRRSRIPNITGCGWGMCCWWMRTVINCSAFAIILLFFTQILYLFTLYTQLCLTEKPILHQYCIYSKLLFLF